jgi:hypothetical protein
MFIISVEIYQQLKSEIIGCLWISRKLDKLWGRPFICKLSHKPWLNLCLRNSLNCRASLLLDHVGDLWKKRRKLAVIGITCFQSVVYHKCQCHSLYALCHSGNGLALCQYSFFWHSCLQRDKKKEKGNNVKIIVCGYNMTRYMAYSLKYALK